MRAAEIHDQQNRRKNRAANRRDPHGDPRKIDMVKKNRTTRNDGRHPGHPAEEKVERHLPCPHRRFHHRLTIISWFARNRTAGNINAFARDDAILPCLLAQLFEPLFRLRPVRHEKNAKATSVATIDAIAVANAAVQADFK